MDIGVLTVAVAGVAFLAVRETWRAWGWRHRDQGRTWRMWVAGMLVMSCAVMWFVEASYHHRQNLATSGIRAVAQPPDATADCERFTQALFNASAYDGFVYHDNPTVAVLKRSVCFDVHHYARGGFRNPTLDQIIAVNLLAHEAMHINGVWNEAEAECYAVQVNHLVAEELGASREQARELQRRYFEELYPRMPSAYRTSQCRDGTSLDLFPERSEFP